MSKIIIAIHGLGNKPPHSLLEKWWHDALIEGLNKIEASPKDFTFKLVYWADILYEHVLDPDISDNKNPYFLDEPYRPSDGKTTPHTEGLKTRFLKYAEKQLDKIFLKPDMTLNYEGVTDSIIHNYFRELEIYFQGDATEDSQPNNYQSRNAIRERLIKTLAEHKDDDILLIAHSMGTIVAYEVLQDFAEEFSINTFVTIGSPLGLPVVVSRIYADQNRHLPQEKKLCAPDNIRHYWYNLSDTEDMVALDPTLADDYEPNKSGIRAKDISVFNDYEMNGERNPHKSFGYLRTPEMAKIVIEFLNEKEKSRWEKFYSRIKKRIAALFPHRKQ
jgi:PGAP1-like protein